MFNLPRRLTVSVVLASLVRGVLPAQEIRGILRSPDGATPGAILQVLNAVDGSAMASQRVLQDGVFQLRVGPDSVIVRVLRVGFRPETLLVARLRAGEVRDVSRELSASAVRIPATVVRARSSCDSNDAEMNRWAVAMFEQLLIALAATRSNVDSPGFLVRTMIDSMRVTADERQELWNRSATLLTASVGPDFADTSTLDRDGFRSRSRSREESYRIPGPDYFMRPTFLESHCLHYAGIDPANRELVGLGFAPLDTSEHLVGVAGTFWLRAADASPSQLDFRFVGGTQAEREGRPEGWIELSAGADAAWYFSRWRVRMPQIGRLTVRLRDRSKPPTVTDLLSGILFVGGETIEVREGSRLLFSSASADSVDSRRRRVTVRDSSVGGNCAERTGFAALSGIVLVPPSIPTTTLELAWREFTPGRATSRIIPSARTSVRSGGAFVLCGIPTGRSIELVLSRRGSTAPLGTTTIRIPFGRTQGRLPTWAFEER